jgi:hypothetical protein
MQTLQAANLLTGHLASEIVVREYSRPVLEVEGGGGFVQQLGDGAMFGAFGLTENDTQQLAARVKAAMFASDIQAILAIIPTDAERQAVVTRALAIGADVQLIRTALAQLANDAQSRVRFAVARPFAIAWGIASTVSFAASVYHGYKRNDSVGWAIWWGLMGGLFPVITPTIAFAQGFAKPKRAGFGRAKLRAYHGRGRNRQRKA